MGPAIDSGPVQQVVVPEHHGAGRTDAFDGLGQIGQRGDFAAIDIPAREQGMAAKVIGYPQMGPRPHGETAASGPDMADVDRGPHREGAAHALDGIAVQVARRGRFPLVQALAARVDHLAEGPAGRRQFPGTGQFFDVLVDRRIVQGGDDIGVVAAGQVAQRTGVDPGGRIIALGVDMLPEDIEGARDECGTQQIALDHEAPLFEMSFFRVCKKPHGLSS